MLQTNIAPCIKQRMAYDGLFAVYTMLYNVQEVRKKEELTNSIYELISIVSAKDNHVKFSFHIILRPKYKGCT